MQLSSPEIKIILHFTPSPPPPPPKKKKKEKKEKKFLYFRRELFSRPKNSS